MNDMTVPIKWRDRGRKALSAAVVIVCYLVVFAGIIYSIAGG